MKMLICDDDTMTTRVLEFQFKRDGFEVLKSNSGREARKILDENDDIDVMITDIYMPSMNGLELITYVRQTLQRNFPIVVVSQVSLEDNIVEALDLEADDYMTKPCNLEHLSLKVNKLLKR
jgi:DNA-binding response OmpR family regulator